MTTDTVLVHTNNIKKLAGCHGSVETVSGSIAKVPDYGDAMPNQTAMILLAAILPALALHTNGQTELTRAISPK